MPISESEGNCTKKKNVIPCFYPSIAFSAKYREDLSVIFRSTVIHDSHSAFVTGTIVALVLDYVLVLVFGHCCSLWLPIHSLS